MKTIEQRDLAEVSGGCHNRNRGCGGAIYTGGCGGGFGGGYGYGYVSAVPYYTGGCGGGGIYTAGGYGYGGYGYGGGFGGGYGGGYGYGGGIYAAGGYGGGCGYGGGQAYVAYEINGGGCNRGC